MAARRTGRKPPRQRPAAKVSAADLDKRNGLRDRIAQLEQAANEIQAEQLKMQGRWEAFREDIEAKYAMTPADTIDEDGTIIRADTPPPEEQST